MMKKWNGILTTTAMVLLLQACFGGKKFSGLDISFQKSEQSVMENAGLVIVKLKSSEPAAERLSVPYTVSGTADAADHDQQNGSVIFDAGSSSAEIRINVADDLAYEGNETVIFRLTDRDAYQSAGNQHTLTILDNEAAPVIGFTATSGNGAESANAVIPVSLSAAVSATVTVDYAVTGGTATGGGTDYLLNSGSLTIAPGATTASVSVNINDDLMDENNETFIITISNPQNSTLGANATYTYTINDNDAAPTLQFLSAASAGAESVSPAALTVVLSNPSFQAITADYAVTGGTATVGADYQSLSGTVSFAAGVTTATINLQPVDDSTDEADETVAVTLSNVSAGGSLGGVATHTYTIQDNDAKPTVQFSAASSAGGESVTPASLVISLSNPSYQNVTVDYAVTGGTASSGTDFNLTAGTATVTAGNTTTSVTLNVVSDSVYEPNETVIIGLSNASASATLSGNTSHTYTINDDDAQPTIQFTSASSSGSEAASPVQLIVALSNASYQNISASYAVTGGTATGSGTDYTLNAGTVNIAAGSTTAAISFSVNDDVLVEGFETVIVGLSSPSNAALGGNSSHTYTINDNEGTPVLQFQAASSSGAESVAGSLVVTMTAITGSNVTVDYAVTGGTATGGGTDYLLNSGTLTITAGSSSAAINLPVTDDNIDEADETVIVTLSNVSAAATLGGQAAHTYTIQDNDATPVLQFAAATGSGSESVSPASFIVSISNPSSQNITVDYNTTGGTATAGADYTALNGTATITAGNTTTAINLTVNNDATDEPDETVIVTLSNVSAAGSIGAQTTHTYTIQDNDATPVLQFAAATGSGSESVSPASFIVSLSNPSSQNITVDYNSTGGTATAGADYTALSGTATITAGNTTTAINLTVNNDTTDEPDETVIVTLSNVSAAGSIGAQTTHAYTIQDNDATPVLQFAAATGSGSESVSPASFIVSLSNPSSQNITVDYATTGGTATAGADYTALSGTATITAGNTTTAINLTVNNDTTDEPDETVIVTLSNVSAAGSIGAQTTHTYTIQDNDATPTLQFLTANSSGAESVTPVTLVVGLSNPSYQNQTVDFAVTGGTATGSSTDYLLNAGTITITAGSTTAALSFAVNDDAIDEANETVIIGLSNASAGASLSGNTSHTYTINDNDATPTVQFSAASSNGSESVTGVPLVITASGLSSQNITVDYAVSGGTAMAGADFNALTGTATIVAGTTTTAINLTVINDITDEPNETVIIGLSNASASATLSGNTSHTYTINDDDATPTVQFSAAASNGDEGTSPAIMVVALSHPSYQNVTVDYAVTGGSATVGADYSALTGTATITAGNTTTAINLTVNNDTMDEADETVIIGLSNASASATLSGNTSHTYTINDNDAKPTVQFSSAASGNSEAVTSVSFVIALSNPSYQNVTVDYATTGGTATSGPDYTALSGTATITAGNTTTAINLTVNNDTDNESDETVIISLSNASASATLSGNTTHTYTIADNDSKPTLEFSSATSSAAESVSPTFVITLSSAIGTNVTVDYAVTGGTATSGGDYTAFSGTATITAGNTTTGITLNVTDDVTDEQDETVAVTLSNISANATLTGNTVHTHTIQDNDATPTVQFSAAASNGDEASSPAALLISLSNPSYQNITVDYATTGGTATSGSDFTALSGTATITAGNTTATVNLVINNDIMDEPNETVVVTLSNASAGASLSGNTTHTYTINDNDATPTVQFSAATSAGGENVSPASLVISLSGPSSQNVTVDYATTGGTATSGVDYTALSGTATITAGNTTIAVNLSIVNDSAYEPDETVIVTLSNASASATLSGNTTHTYTIQNNDAAPTIQFAAATSSGDEGTSPAVLIVSLSNPSYQNVTVDYANTGGTATAGTDYTALSGTATITAGSTTTAVNLVVANDTTDEPNETVIITLSNVSVGATLSGNTTHTYTINDNDATPTIQFVSASSNGDEGSSPVSLVIALSNPSSQNVTIDYATTGGTAASGIDYTALSGTATVLAGTTTTAVNLVINNDVIDEPNETVIVTLSNASAAATLSGNTTHTYTINDNDATPTVQFAAASSNGDEGSSPVSLVVFLSGPSSQNVTVDYATTGGTATAGSDYTALSGTATITAGNTTTAVNLVINNDTTDEPNETVIVTLSNASVSATLSGNTTHTYTINDNDATPTVQFSAASSNGDEGASPVSLVIALSNPSSQNVTVDYATTGGTATAGSDYTALSGTATITAGNTTTAVNLVINNDVIDEPNETVIVTLSNASVSATLSGNTTHTYTINDNDATPTVQFSAASSNGDEGTSPVSLVISLSGLSSQNVTVDYATTGGTATAGADYTALSGTATITAGTTTTAVSLVISNDTMNEPNETVVITLSNASASATLSGNTTHTYTINDNDAAPTLQFVSAASNGDEGSSPVSLVIALSNPASQNVTVDYATTGGTATAGSDYTALSGTATITAGNTTTAVNLVINNDITDEPNETVIVTLSNVSAAATLSGNTAHTYTINDNDATPTVQFAAASSNGDEGSSPVSLVISLSNPSSQNVTIDYATTGGSATAGSDYTALSGTATITAGNTTTAVSLVINNDTTDEPNETVIVTLSNASVSATLSGNTTHAYTINDNDATPTVQFSAASSNGSEASSPVSLVISLSNPSYQNVTVDYATTGGTATAGSDYTALSGTATITAGNTTTAVNLVVNNDTTDEPNETVVVTLSNASASASLSGNTTHTYTINDNDATPTVQFSAASSNGDEGSSPVAMVISLSNPSYQNVTIDYATTGGTATAGSDYTALSGTATITAGNTTTAVNLVINNDTTDEPNETVVVTLSNASVSATLSGNTTHTYTINDNDATPTVQFSAASSNGDEGSSPVSMVISLSNPSYQNVTIDYATMGGSATAGSDYTALSGTATITAGNTTTAVSLVINNDTTDEPNETVVITLSNASASATLSGNTTHTYTINDNDPTPTLQFALASSNGGENITSVSLVVSLSNPSYQNQSADFAVTGGTATGSGTDYLLNGGTITVTAGSTTAAITLTVNDDNMDELNETVTVTLSNGSSGVTLSGNTSHTYTINDNDAAPTVQFASAASNGDEAVTPAQIVISLSNPSYQNITVDYVSANGSATGGADYTAASGTATITAGNTTTTVNVTISNDTLDEIDETLTLTLSNASAGGSLGGTTVHTYTINDNDDAPTVSFALASQSGSETSSGAVTVVMTLSAVSGKTITVPFSVSGSGTATLTSDYTLSASPITINAGSSTGGLTLTIVNDTTPELSETVILNMGAPTNATTAAPTSHTFTINASDVTISGHVRDNITLGDVAGASVSSQDSNLNVIATTTDASGNFSLVSDYFNLSSVYSITVSKTGYITDSGVQATISAATNTITGNPVTLVRQTGSITGVVKDDHTTNNLSGVTVTATDGTSTLRSTTTAADGSFTLSGNFFLGSSYTVNFSKTNYFNNSAGVTINLTGNNDVTGNPIHLYINATITGRALSDLGGGAANVTVSVTDSNGATIQTTTDSGGYYTLTGTGTQPNTSFRKGAAYTISFSSVDYNNNSASASSLVGGANNPTPDPITLITNKDGNHIISGRVIDYWENSVGVTTGIDSARIEVDDESSTKSTTATASGNFTITVNMIATKTYNLRILVPVSGTMVNKYTGTDTTTNTNTTMVATNVAMPPASGNTQNLGNYVLHPIGIRAVIGGTSRYFNNQLKQTHEKFLTGKTGFTFSGRSCTTCNAAGMATTSTFFIHADDASPATVPSTLIPTFTTDNARGNPTVSDINATHISVGGSAVKGSIHHGLTGDTRATGWGINGYSVFYFRVTNDGNFTLTTGTPASNYRPSDALNDGAITPDTYVYLYNSAGTLVASNDNISGGNKYSQISNQALSAGWYFIKVAPGSTTTTSAGYGIFDMTLTSATEQSSAPTGTFTTNDIILSWYDAPNTMMYIIGQNESSSSGSITIDKNEAVNKLARGSFSGTLKSIESSPASATMTNGYYNVVRSE